MQLVLACAGPDDHEANNCQEVDPAAISCSLAIFALCIDLPCALRAGEMRPHFLKRNGGDVNLRCDWVQTGQGHRYGEMELKTERYLSQKLRIWHC